MIAYLKAMYDFSPLCKISHVQTLHNPVVPGLALSHRSRMPYMQSKSRFTNLRIRLFFSPDKQTQPFTPSPTWIVACFSKEHQHQLVSFGRAELQAGGKRGAFTCHLLPKASKDQQGDGLFWRIRSTTEWRTSSNFW